VGGPDEEVAKEICALATEQGINVDYRSVVESKVCYYYQLLNDREIVPRAGFLDIFNYLKDLGLKFAIGSLTKRENATLLLQKSGLMDLFGNEYIVLGDDVQHVKPAPDVWIETARRMGVDPEDQIIFEDSPRGIIAAKKINAYPIAMPVYRRPDVIQNLVYAGANRIFANWDEINPEGLLRNIDTELNGGQQREANVPVLS